MKALPDGFADDSFFSVMTRISLCLATYCLLASTSMALGEVYSCATDPGFCYLDGGNDGCFDPPADAGPIDALLEAGTYAPPAGSIVCPPSVRDLKAATIVDWSTAPGSHVALFRTKIRALGGLSIDSGERVFIGGRLMAREALQLTITAATDVVIEGVLQTPGAASVTSTAGHIQLDGAKMIGGQSVELTTLGDGHIVLDNVRLIARNNSWPNRTIDVAAGGDVLLHDTQAKARSNIAFAGDNVTSTGKLTVKSTASNLSQIFFATAPGGAVSLERLSCAVTQGIAVDAGSLLIGLPGANGKVARSTIRMADKNGSPGSGPTGLDVNVTGDVLLDTVVLRNFHEIDIETSGSTLDWTDGRVQNIGSIVGASTNITAGPGSTCDLTGTIFLNTTLTATCDTVVGP